MNPQMDHSVPLRAGTEPHKPASGTRRQLLHSALAGSVASVGAAALAACGVLPGVRTSAEQQKALPPANLNYTTWWLPPLAFGTATEKALGAFETSHPGVRVKIEPMPDNAAADLEKLQALVAANTPPDLSLVRPHHMGYFANRGTLAAVDDRLAKDRRAARGDFFPVALERLVWKQKMWGLPAEVWFELNLFNEDLFAAAGQPFPDASWTWERWLEAARRLTAAGANRPARTFGTALPSWEVFVWNWGGEIMNQAGTECVLNRTPAPEALQWRADASLRHQVVPTIADLGGQNARAFFTSGRLGMFPIGNWALLDVASATTMRWSTSPLPQGKVGPLTIGAGANYAVFTEGKQQDAAWALLTDLALGDGLKTLLAGSALFPAFRPMAKQEWLPSYKPDWLKAALKAGEKARQPHYDHPQYVQINQAITDQLAALWNGDRPAQAAADEAARQVNALLK